MDRAHTPLLEMIATIPKKKLDTVVDFGCGNGALLKKVISQRPGCIPYGVDVLARRIHHARLLHPQYRENFEVCSMFDPSARWLQSDLQYALALLMIGRLLEVTQHQRIEFIKRLEERCKRVLVYFYGGWVEENVGLPDLAKRCQFRLLKLHPSKAAGFANLAKL